MDAGWKRVIQKATSGRFILLLQFGTTICLMSSLSLIAVLFMGKNDEKYISIVTFFAGYLTGAFSKMWDSYSYRSDRTKPEEPIEERTDEKVSSTSNVVVSNDSPGK